MLPWSPGTNTAATSLLRPHGADGEPVAHRLGHRDDVGHDTGVFEAEPLTGAGEAGLHLVDHHQQATLVAQRTDPSEVLGVGRDHTAFALHRLDQHRRHRRIDRRLERGEVAERHVTEAVGHREERLVLGRLAGRRQRRQRAAVEAAVGAHHHVATAAAELAGQLQRGLVGLGAGVAEEHLALVAGGLRRAGRRARSPPRWPHRWRRGC